MTEYLLRNDILNTTNEALRAHCPEWMDRLSAAAKQLTDEEAEKHGVSRYRSSRIDMNTEDAASLARILSQIEAQVGSDKYFSNFPISAATSAWSKLSAAMGENTDSPSLPS